MYYRVKRFSSSFSTLYVLDQDTNLARLQNRTIINCAGIGARVFNDAQLIVFQPIFCQNIDKNRPSHIISSN
jgi:hypothetical protein